MYINKFANIVLYEVSCRLARVVQNDLHKPRTFSDCWTLAYLHYMSHKLCQSSSHHTQLIKANSHLPKYHLTWDGNWKNIHMSNKYKSTVAVEATNTFAGFIDTMLRLTLLADYPQVQFPRSPAMRKCSHSAGSIYNRPERAGDKWQVTGVARALQLWQMSVLQPGSALVPCSVIGERIAPVLETTRDTCILYCLADTFDVTFFLKCHLPLKVRRSSRLPGSE